MKLLRPALALATLLSCDSRSVNLLYDGRKDAQDLGALAEDASPGLDTKVQCGYDLKNFPAGFQNEKNVFTGYLIIPDDGVPTKNLAVSDFAYLASAQYGTVFPVGSVILQSEISNPQNNYTVAFGIGCDHFISQYFGETLSDCDSALKQNVGVVASRQWSTGNVGIAVVAQNRDLLRPTARLLFSKLFAGLQGDAYAIALRKYSRLEPTSTEIIDNCIR